MLVRSGDDGLERAAALLREGGLVAFPTETVYGLGANAFDARAVARIFEAKGRPAFDPLIVHVLDEAMLARVAAEISANARRAIERFWPGPLTLVLRKTAAIPDIVTSGLPTVAVRMPSDPTARALLERCGVPLAAPSANPFGYLSPTRAEHVARMLGDRVDLILDAGPATYGVESTILMPDPRPVLLRAGAVPVEELEAALGPIGRDLDDAAAPLVPGRLPRHYSPTTPIRVVDFAGVPSADRAAAAGLGWREPPQGYALARSLSPAGDLREAASRFFELLHELDAAGVRRIDVEPVPERGLGLAIADRLRRASAQAGRL